MQASPYANNSEYWEGALEECHAFWSVCRTPTSSAISVGQVGFSISLSSELKF